MKTHQYWAHIICINNEELPLLPPFKPNQSIPVDELVDILIWATPKSWYKEMTHQGFDPFTNPASAVLNFCECMEETEDFDPVKSQGKDDKKKKSPSKKDGSKHQEYCMLHGYGGHATGDCKSLKAQAKCMKDNHASGNHRGNSKNKTWKRKADDAKKVSKKELAAFIGKSVKESLHQELNCTEKKRKADSDDDSDDKVLINLAKFNFNDLSIDDEEKSKNNNDDLDEISV